MGSDLDQGGRLPQSVKTYLGPTVGWKQTDSPVNIEFLVNLSGGVPSGLTGLILCPDWLLINNWVILSTASCTLTLDIWRLNLSQVLTGPPISSANSICGGNYPTITSDVHAYSATLTGWSTTLNQNDVLGFSVVSGSGGGIATLALQCIRVIGPS